MVASLILAVIEDERCMISEDNHSAPMITTVLHGDNRSLLGQWLTMEVRYQAHARGGSSNSCCDQGPVEGLSE